MQPIIKTTKPRVKNYTYFIGTDVSRNKLDHAVMQGKVLLYHKEIKNEREDIDLFIKELKALKGFTISRAIFCMEQTGVYCNHLLERLQKVKANIVLEGAAQIRNSLGNIRGKNDKIDAIRIAEYTYKCREELRFYIPKRPIIQQLAQMVTLRNRLLSTQVMLRVPLKEQDAFARKKVAQQTTRLCLRSVNSITEDLAEVELATTALWQSDERLTRLMELVTSVASVGPVTALQIILTTNEFKDIHNPKKFACYAGVAPFIKESGTSKGRARVSHMANKKVKALLHTCAMHASRHVPDIKAYYERKTQEEGKNKMAVLNAIRYKLILRIFACVNQDRLYERIYVRPASPTAPQAEIGQPVAEQETILS